MRFNVSIWKNVQLIIIIVENDKFGTLRKYKLKFIVHTKFHFKIEKQALIFSPQPMYSASVSQIRWKAHLLYSDPNK